MIYHRPDKPVGDNEFKKGMRKVEYSIILTAALLLMYACHKEERENSTAIETVECSSVENNALRVNIDTKFSKDCEYSITYWLKDSPSESITTRIRQSEGLEGHDTLLFLYPESTYCFTVKVEGNDAEPAGPFEFQTYSLPDDMPQYTVKEGVENKIPGYIFQTQIAKPGYIMISNTDGKVVWYQYIDQASRHFDFCAEEGKIWMLTGFKESSTGDFQRLAKRILCIDFYGNVLHSWSIKDNEIDIPYAHHEIRRMPDGNIVVVSSFTKEYDLTPLGGEPETTLYGDGFTIFNTEGKILRTWDFFGTLDPLNCSFIKPIKRPHDLLHANSFNWDSEGNYYMTFNQCSQLWKIDSKTGEVMYRVGPDGNVALDKSGFAQGLHAATPLGPDRVLCLDNGSERKSSRAIIYDINPETMTADVELSVSLDEIYSSRDRSNVELILEDSMLMFGMTVSHYVVFTDLKGNVKKAIQREGMSYRTHYLEKLPEY